MGVIINETITLPNGLTVTDAYASLGENDITITKRTERGIGMMVNYESTDGGVTTRYIIHGRFTLWVNAAMRDNKGPSIDTIHVKVESETPYTVNVYDLIYDELKTTRKCTDAI
jgi:hypothetical protein